MSPSRHLRYASTHSVHAQSGMHSYRTRQACMFMMQCNQADGASQGECLIV